MSNRMLKKSLAMIMVVMVVNVSGNRRIRRSASCAMKYQQFPGHTACLATSLGATTFDLTSEEKQRFLDLHNQLRASVTPTASDMLKMSWDDEVAMIAKKWTDSCNAFKGGSLHHDKNYHRLIPGRFSLGQNLGYTTGKNVEILIQAWYDENKDYEYGKALSIQTGMVGHYTQLVWAKSYKLGCSKAICEGGMVFACNYGPAGNLASAEKPYESGSSKCKKEVKGLCDCGNMECDNGSPLDVSTCTCTCTPNYFLDSNCKFSCKFNDTKICGLGDFTKDNCHSGPFATTISQRCPHMCKVCPYAEPGYIDNKKGSSDTVRPSMMLLFLLGLLAPLISRERSLDVLA